MSDLTKLSLVLLSGLLFTSGDVAARHWGEQPTSLFRILILVIVGTAAYFVFGILTRHAEFSKVAIWVSISLTTTSCLVGLIWFGDEVTKGKAIAFSLALIAAYFSVK